MLPSGRQTIFENKLQWALSYLEQGRLIESDGAKSYRVTNLGKQHTFTDELSGDFSRAMEQVVFKAPDPNATRGSGMAEEPDTIHDNGSSTVIADEFELLYQNLKISIIDRIHAQTPEFFENLIIDLLLSMGYGDRRRDLVSHLGRTGDGGIDGAIKQDQLGLDVVYMQAKRYRPGLAVPVSAVRDFAGALVAHKANKGLFVTTSHFTKSGHQFITAVSSRIVLIDGKRLASLLIRNNIGVKIHETYEIKKINKDYFQ